MCVESFGPTRRWGDEWSFGLRGLGVFLMSSLSLYFDFLHHFEHIIPSRTWLAVLGMNLLRPSVWESIGRPAGRRACMASQMKLLLSMYTRIEAESLSSRSIMVNACCPGWASSLIDLDLDLGMMAVWSDGWVYPLGTSDLGRYLTGNAVLQWRA